MFELTKQFRFDAAHTLARSVESESSRRIHGHSYRAEVTISGTPDPASGMIFDLGLLERVMADARDALDHCLLDDVEGLGPATLENLSSWIWHRLRARVPGLTRVTVYRDSGNESCAYLGPEKNFP